MTKQLSNSTLLKRAGWRVKGSGPSALYQQPGTDRFFKESHAMLVLQQLEAAEEMGKAVQNTINAWEKYMNEVLIALQPTIDDLWPIPPKGHGRLKTCDLKFGCSIHTQIVWDPKTNKFKYMKESK